ncbi:MAG: aspartate/glutamate racemase family protein [Comamonas sp.]
MQNWLIINPNTSAGITQALLQRVAARTQGLARCQAATARFGAPYIASEASYAVAGHAVLDAWACHEQTLAGRDARPDAYLVGCFGDPGVAALQEVTGRPVIGLAEAAFAEASAFGRFAIVTGGARWQPMLHKLALAQGYGLRLAGLHMLDATGAELAADPERARTRLRLACEQAARDFAADAVILGGAGLAGLADGWYDQLAVPVIDSVDAGARQLLARSAAWHADTAEPPLPPHPALLAWPR